VTSLNWIRTSTFASFRAEKKKKEKKRKENHEARQRQSPSATPSSFTTTRGMVEFTFPSFEDEGHAFPTGIIDPQRRRGKSGARGVRRDSIVIKIAWFPVGTHVLAEECVVSLDRRDCT
jgi:hypothetical protein